MSAGTDRRLERLEASLLPSLDKAAIIRAMTWDELQVKIMDLSRQLAADPDHPQADRDEAAARVAEIEEGVRHQARAHLDPAYAKHLAYVSSGQPGYVPVVCGSRHEHGFVDAGWAEYDDLRKPRIMARRAALRARPDIARLIVEAAALPSAAGTEDRP